MGGSAVRVEDSSGSWEGPGATGRVPVALGWNLDFSLLLLGNHQKVSGKGMTVSHFKEIIHQMQSHAHSISTNIQSWAP